MKCTDPNIGQLITRYELGALKQPEKDAFVSHLIQCEYCHNELYSMAPFMDVLRKRRATLQPEAVFAGQGVVQEPSVPNWVSLRHRKHLLLAASLLLALSAGFLVYDLLIQPSTSPVVDRSGPFTTTSELARNNPIAWRDLMVPKASAVPSTRQTVLRGTGAEPAFERGMTAYQQNDFSTAARQFEVISRLEPEDAEAHFYWGVSLLLAGDHQGAIKPLEKAVRISAGTQRESIHYYLALAYLKADRTSQALVQLEAVIRMQGEHRIDAERLKQQIDLSR